MSRIPLSLEFISIAALLMGCSELVSQPQVPPAGPPQPGPLVVVITNKFTNQFAGGPAISVNATVSNDSATLSGTNSGVAFFDHD